MRTSRNAAMIGRALLAATGWATVAYAAVAGVTWWRYGKVATAGEAEADPLLDRFLPSYEVVERHHVSVDAPAAITLAAARDQDLQNSAVV
jgi:hypothetical protein